MEAATPVRPVAFLVAGDPATATGGFVYSRRMIAALRAAGRLDAVIALPDRFPRGDGDSLVRAEVAIAALPAKTLVIVDGLAFTALAPTLARRADLKTVALIHHPLCDESGLTDGERRAWFDAERQALATADHVIVSSQTTRRRLADFDVANERISVVKPGIDAPDRRPRRRAPPRQGDLTLLTVANLIPRKGQDLLITALIRLRRHPWRLRLVGPARDRAYARRLRLLIRRSGLDNRITLTGEVSSRRLAALYAGADLFVLPSHHEGFGIALIEAVAHGVPLLTTRAGAIPEATPPGTAILVPPAHVPALADALSRLLVGNRRLLQGLQRRAEAAAAQCRRWPEAEGEFVAVVSRLCGGGS